jgi:hypothetical protein
MERRSSHLHNLNQIARILGISHRFSRYSRLNMTIHIKTSHQTVPIAEPVLLSIYNDCQQRERDAIDLIAHGAERRDALGMLPVENVHLVENSNVAILDIPAQPAKTDTRHPSIIPKDLAERLLDNAQAYGYKTLLPNYRSVWRRITNLAEGTYHVRLTSHYFRNGSKQSLNEFQPMK